MLARKKLIGWMVPVCLLTTATWVEGADPAKAKKTSEVTVSTRASGAMALVAGDRGPFHVNAPSAILGDIDTGTILLAQDAQIAMHPAYQRIIGMGSEVLPLILRRLSRKPDHWFWALEAITGENPVPESSQGRLGEMAEAWLDWARSHGYVV